MERIAEKQGTFCGISGTFSEVSTTDKGLIVKQTFTARRDFANGGACKVIVRFDDHCGNGHATFTITGDYKDSPGKWHESGCLHDRVAQHFPEIAHLIKWHLVSTSYPLHYVANTIYHAQDTDHSGLKAGEYGSYSLTVVSDEISTAQAVTLYRTDEIYTNRTNNVNLAKSNTKAETALQEFCDHLTIPYRIEKTGSSWSLSKGKERNLDYARSTAIWPDATDEQLCAPRAELEAALLARLPALMSAFQADLVASGFAWSL